MATDPSQLRQNDFTLLDIYQITVSMADHIVESSNRRFLRKTKLKKMVVDVGMKSLGKIAEEQIKELVKAGGPHAELLLPLSILSGTALEELGKSFAEVILHLSTEDEKFIDQLMKAGFQNAKLIFEQGSIGLATGTLKKSKKMAQAINSKPPLKVAEATAR